MISLSISKDITKDYVQVFMPFKKLHEYTGRYNYSSSSFTGGKRNQANVCSLGNVMIFDFDDGSISIDELKEFLESNAITSYIATSKSHNKDKHGVVCERYRLIVPLHKKISLPLEDYGDFYMFVARVLQINSAIDVVCRDRSRFYYPNPEQSYWYIETGYIFDTDVLIKNFRIIQKQNQEKEREAKEKKAKQYKEVKKRTGDKLLKNEVPTDTQVELKGGESYPLSYFSYLHVGESVPCRCLNPAHEDKHPSAFISRSNSELGGLKIECSSCGYTVFSPVER